MAGAIDVIVLEVVAHFGLMGIVGRSIRRTCRLSATAPHRAYKADANSDVGVVCCGRAVVSECDNNRIARIMKDDQEMGEAIIDPTAPERNHHYVGLKGLFE